MDDARRLLPAMSPHRSVCERLAYDLVPNPERKAIE